MCDPGSTFLESGASSADSNRSPVFILCLFRIDADIQILNTRALETCRKSIEETGRYGIEIACPWQSNASAFRSLSDKSRRAVFSGSRSCRTDLLDSQMDWASVARIA